MQLVYIYIAHTPRTRLQYATKHKISNTKLDFTRSDWESEFWSGAEARVEHMPHQLLSLSSEELDHP